MSLVVISGGYNQVDCELITPHRIYLTVMKPIREAKARSRAAVPLKKKKTLKVRGIICLLPVPQSVKQNSNFEYTYFPNVFLASVIGFYVYLLNMLPEISEIQLN
jgi:hypothetical protein